MSSRGVSHRGQTMFGPPLSVLPAAITGVARLRLQDACAVRAIEEVLAGIRRHRLPGLVSAVRARDQRLQFESCALHSSNAGWSTRLSRGNVMLQSLPSRSAVPIVADDKTRASSVCTLILLALSHWLALSPDRRAWPTVTGPVPVVQALLGAGRQRLRGYRFRQRTRCRRQVVEYPMHPGHFGSFRIWSIGIINHQN